MTVGRVELKDFDLVVGLDAGQILGRDKDELTVLQSSRNVNQRGNHLATKNKDRH
jgi:hypothetical protein